jgi:hypothetical protein
MTTLSHARVRPPREGARLGGQLFDLPEDGVLDVRGLGRYILNDAGEPVECDDVLLWGAWFEASLRNGTRIVKQDFVEGETYVIDIGARQQERGVGVSTVFLALDHNWARSRGRRCCGSRWSSAPRSTARCGATPAARPRSPATPSSSSACARPARKTMNERIAYRTTTINGRKVAVLVLCAACESGRHGGAAPRIITTTSSGVCGCACHRVRRAGPSPRSPRHPARQIVRRGDFLKLVTEKIGLELDETARGAFLLDLREIRQGTRGTSWPT